MKSDFSKYKYRNRIPVRQRMGRFVWEIVYFVLFRPTPRWALHSWRRFLLRLFGAKIGDGTRISPSCKVWAPWNLEIGNYTALGDFVDCYNVAKIIVGSKVAISQRSFLCTASHDISSLSRPLTCDPIAIGDHAWVASEAMLLPGVNIGEGAVIAARSLVTKNMPSWFVCAGSPCKPLHKRVVESPSGLLTVSPIERER